MLEKACFLNSIDELNDLPRGTARVYIGSEHCVRAFPLRFTALFMQARKKYPVTLMTPPLLESEFKMFVRIIKIFLANASKKDEITVNDWGVLSWLLGQKKRVCGVNLGRLFSYQKRGTQRLYGTVNAKELSEVPVLDDLMVRYLKKNGVRRVEIDSSMYGIRPDIKPDIRVSVFEPYAVNSYTLNCPHTFDGRTWIRKCARQCLAVALQYSSGEMKDPVIQQGKIYYTPSYPVSHPCVDRLVSMSWKKHQ